ncbi:MAG: aldose epimerase family protein [Prolixibacteraceae bacterium]
MKRNRFWFKPFCLLLLTSLTFTLFGQAVRDHVSSPGKLPARPSIQKVFACEAEGQKIYEYTLTNLNGMQVKVINYGGKITDIITPDKNGKMGSVVLGLDSLKSYTDLTSPSIGATIGRVGNRISNKKFTLDGQEYILTANIHGGLKGFNKRIWNIEEVPGKKEIALRMNYFSKDGEEGYPGNLNVTVTYTLTNDNELKINYAATTDKATPVTLTNHSYFNLSGGGEAKILKTEVTIFADQYLEANSEIIPTGKILNVKGTPFDFTTPQPIGKRIGDNNEQLVSAKGYDLTYVLRNQSGRLSLAANAFDPVTGRILQVYTTEPGIIFYTGNNLSEKVMGRGGKLFVKNAGFCFETQHFPDSPNQPTFPNTILRPGEKYKSQTIFKFSVRK